jgi:hypothetical protein
VRAGTTAALCDALAGLQSTRHRVRIEVDPRAV